MPTPSSSVSWPPRCICHAAAHVSLLPLGPEHIITLVFLSSLPSPPVAAPTDHLLKNYKTTADRGCTSISLSDRIYIIGDAVLLSVTVVAVPRDADPPGLPHVPTPTRSHTHTTDTSPAYFSLSPSFLLIPCLLNPRKYWRRLEEPNIQAC